VLQYHIQKSHPPVWTCFSIEDRRVIATNIEFYFRFFNVCFFTYKFLACIIRIVKKPCVLQLQNINRKTRSRSKTEETCFNANKVFMLNEPASCACLSLHLLEKRFHIMYRSGVFLQYDFSNGTPNQFFWEKFYYKIRTQSDAQSSRHAFSSGGFEDPSNPQMLGHTWNT